MSFVISSNILAKKCQGLYTKVERKNKELYLKLNEDMCVEFFIQRNEDLERWELIEQKTSKIRASHTSTESCEKIGTNWVIHQGATRRKGLIKFVAESAQIKGKKRRLNEDKKTVKRAFGRKVSQDCKPLVAKSMNTTATRRPRTHILEDFPTVSKTGGKQQCDIENEDNHLYVTEYAKDIISFLKKTESDFLPARDYIEKKQPHWNSNHRNKMINWMNAVVSKYEQTDASFHLAVNIFDRFLSKKMIEQNQLHLVSCVCLWIAAKYIEVQVPVTDDFIILADESFDTEDMVDMECEIVNALEFRLTVPTALNFSERYGLILKYMLDTEKHQRRIIPLINYFIEHCTLIYELVGEKPSLIAAAASYAAAVWLDGNFEWTKELQKEVGYTVEEMEGIVGLIRHEVYEKIRPETAAKLHVFEKYQTRSKEYVALMRYSASSKI